MMPSDSASISPRRDAPEGFGRANSKASASLRCPVRYIGCVSIYLSSSLFPSGVVKLHLSHALIVDKKERKKNKSNLPSAHGILDAAGAATIAS